MTPFPSKIPHPLFSFSTNDLLLLKGLYAVYTTTLLLEIVIQMQFGIFIFFPPKISIVASRLGFFKLKLNNGWNKAPQNLEAN